MPPQGRRALRPAPGPSRQPRSRHRSLIHQKPYARQGVTSRRGGSGAAREPTLLSGSSRRHRPCRRARITRKTASVDESSRAAMIMLSTHVDNRTSWPCGPYERAQQVARNACKADLGAGDLPAEAWALAAARRRFSEAAIKRRLAALAQLRRSASLAAADARRRNTRACKGTRACRLARAGRLSRTRSANSWQRCTKCGSTRSRDLTRARRPTPAEADPATRRLPAPAMCAGATAVQQARGPPPRQRRDRMACLAT